jgi:hypothetical protein
VIRFDEKLNEEINHNIIDTLLLLNSKIISSVKLSDNPNTDRMLVYTIRSKVESRLLDSRERILFPIVMELMNK